MDLGTIEKMIREGNVKGGDDLVRLITKVVTNALTYNNASDHVVHQEALVLRKVLGEVSFLAGSWEENPIMIGLHSLGHHCVTALRYIIGLHLHLGYTLVLSCECNSII